MNKSDKYTSTCEIIYNMISRRIKERRDTFNLANSAICPAADPNLVSAIINNRRDEKKNKYLIPDGTKGTSISDNTTPFVEIIATNLSYSSVNELLIGTHEEYKSYAGMLFYHMIEDAIHDESESTANTIKDLLSDFIPFAKADAFLDSQDENGDITSLAVPKNESFDIEDYIDIKKKAVARYFNLVENEFELLYSNFFVERPNTIKLNQRLSEFVTSKLLPLMKRNRRYNGLIVNAREIYANHIQRQVDFLKYTLKTTPERSDYHEYDEAYWTYDVMDEWSKAEADYIARLEEIQKEAEGEPDVFILENNWKSDMCLRFLEENGL